MITLFPQSASSVPLPPAGQKRLFLDSADQVLKTKDSAGDIVTTGLGTATELAVTGGGPVLIDGGGAPAVGYALLATSPTTADWQQLPPASLQSAEFTGPSALTVSDGDVGTLFRLNITAGSITYALPTAVSASRTNRQIEYKIIGLASGNTVTITPAGLEEIDGVNAPFVMNTDNEYFVLRSDGAGWMVMV